MGKFPAVNVPNAWVRGAPKRLTAFLYTISVFFARAKVINHYYFFSTVPGTLQMPGITI